MTSKCNARKIFLQERKSIRKKNRKQINADINDSRVLAVLVIINLNPHISTRELQRNLEIPYVTGCRILQRQIPSLLFHFNPRCK